VAIVKQNNLAVAHDAGVTPQSVLQVTAKHPASVRPTRCNGVATFAAKSHEAKVTDCSDSSGSGTYYRSGKPAAGGAPGRQAIYAQVQPFDGTWKVTYLVVEKAGSC
jgi:hypothetical protein